MPKAFPGTYSDHVSPRRSAVDARQTRSAILSRGLDVASVEGLQGLTIGRLAADLGLSKSGLLGHFGSKETLQLELIDLAAAVFTHEVADRAAGTAFGMPRLRAMCEAWVSYLERGVFPGGCFFTAVVAEFDDREGPIRDAIVGLTSLWERDLRRQVTLAVAAGEMPADSDADQIVFELVGQMLALNRSLQLLRDRAAPWRTRQAMGRLLGRSVSADVLA
jgi:AcrR family transcriptional regulator